MGMKTDTADSTSIDGVTNYVIPGRRIRDVRKNGVFFLRIDGIRTIHVDYVKVRNDERNFLGHVLLRNIVLILKTVVYVIIDVPISMGVEIDMHVI